MKYILCICAMLAIASCTNNSETRLKELTREDSLMKLDDQRKDSSIASDLTALNQIQDNLDSIESKEKVVSFGGSEVSKESIVARVKALDRLILKNNREINRLETKLKKTDKKNASLEKMVAHLTKELAAKNDEIATLQAKLAKANAGLETLTRQFNDSVAVINRQRAEINNMRSEINSVYYIIGTIKELKSKGIIDKKGGVLGVGRTAELNPDAANKEFTKGNLKTLLSLPLAGKLSKIITTHPESSYKVTGNNKADTLQIIDQVVFWSESRYLVIALK